MQEILTYGMTAAWIAVMIFSILHILLNMRDESERASLWIIIVTGFPVFGVILYWVAGITRQNTLGARVAKSAENFILKFRSGTIAAFAKYRRAQAPFIVPVRNEPEKLLDRFFPENPPLQSNQVELLCDGDKAYPKMIQEIRAAKRFIYLQSFIIANDQIGKVVFDALEEKAAQGVRVRVLYDSFGSFSAMVSHFFRRYAHRNPNLKIRAFSHASLLTPWRIQLRNHRKLLIVDGRTAFLGGMNISSENFRLFRKKRPAIHDLHCRIRGPVVGELQIGFLRDWTYSLKHLPDQLDPDDFPAPAAEGDNCVRAIASGHGHCFQGSENVFFTAVSSARRVLWINTPYFVPDKPFIKALRLAALRGVDVRIIVPKNNNHWFMKMATRSLYEPLLNDGARIFERQGNFSHAKAMLVDGEWALFGSSNCDIRSFRLNYELDIVVSKGTFIDSLNTQFLREFSLSLEVHLHRIENRSMAVRLVESVCALFSPVL